MREDVLLRVYPWVLPFLQIENTCLNPVLLTHTLLTLAIKVPNRLRQCLGDIRVLLLQSVPNCVRRHEIRLAALERLCNAQQTNEISVVGVEKLPRVGTVDTHAVNGGTVFAKVFYMA